MRLLIFILLMPFVVVSQAFPDAYGAAANTTTGGSGQTVRFVTNLNDSGAGSFRAAWVSNSFIVFEVSGTIELLTPIQGAVSNVTVAGQTAPPGGIDFTGIGSNSPLFEIGSCSNLIIRNIRLRKDYFNGANADAFQCNNCDDVILDHVSVAWGGDEAIDFPGNGQRITVQSCLLAESSTGITGGNTDGTSASHSILRNMFVNISHRTPSTSPTDQSDIINNVIHNHYSRLFITSNQDNNSTTKHNFIGNYIQPGQMGAVGPPFSGGTGTNFARNWLDIRDSWHPQEVRVYSFNNYWPGVTEADNTVDYNPLFVHRFAITLGGGAPQAQGAEASTYWRSTSQYDLLGRDITIQNPITAKSEIVQEAGAHYYIDNSGNLIAGGWDAPDNVWRANVADNTWISYSYPINPSGFSYYTAYHSAVSSTPLATRPVNYDQDNDGMSDTWEINTFGDLTKTATGNDLDTTYTNIEWFSDPVLRSVEDPPTSPGVAPPINKRRWVLGQLINN